MLALLMMVSLCAADTSNSGFKKLFQELSSSSSNNSTRVGSYSLRVHSSRVSEKIRPFYSLQELNQWDDFLKQAVQIKIRKGLVQAADRDLGSDTESDPTHYDAVWLRDSLWAYLGLKTQKGRETEAKQVLLKMLDYVASADQLKRFATIIKDPSLLSAKDGAMQVVHIRFDGNSPDFKDVFENGKPQRWNHKQNDALGLLLDLVVRALASNEIRVGDLNDSHWSALAYFPAYFSRIKYYEMEDAGSWEEIERTNTSSIALVTSGLEKLQSVSPELMQRLTSKASQLGAGEFLKPEALSQLVEKGYARVFSQLKAGGESPLYPKSNPRYRKADAALLNLIYPADLSRLTLEHKKRVVEIVQPLIGEVGIRRYLKDSYQSGNFWFTPAETESAAEEKRTDDTSSSENFQARAKQFIEKSEAQWFFDSWYSKAMGVMYRQSQDKSYYLKQTEFFNRSLAQLTGEKMLGADGKGVPTFALPESYNTIASGNRRFFAPSPITPLNWAKAALSIALEDLKTNASHLH